MRAFKFSTIMALLVLLPVAAAQALDLDLRNPAIDALKERIAARAPALQKLKAAGVVGEEATGSVAILPQAKLSLGERKEARDLVVGENEDRAALFREWVIANTMPEAQLAAVAQAFAQKQRTAATPSQWVQDPSSKQWVQKKDLR